MGFVQNFLESKYNLGYYSNNLDKPWHWGGVSCNPNITWDIIINNLDTDIYPWNWSKISRNPNITWEIIQSNPDKPWDWSEISFNKFTLRKKNNTAFTIQRYWRKYKYLKHQKYKRNYKNMILCNVFHALPNEIIDKIARI